MVLRSRWLGLWMVASAAGCAISHPSDLDGGGREAMADLLGRDAAADACAPMGETCDGRDDDCDGVVDETSCLGPQCFAEGTPVEAEDGLVPIEEIREGDLVWSRDPDTGEEGLHRVTQTFVRSAPVMELEVIGEGATDVFVVTGEHPFWRRDREGGGWVRAQDLLPGDEVFTSRGGWARIGAGTWLAREQLVYNFEVEGSHTYFVGETGTWVHNQCGSFLDAMAERIAGGHAFEKHVLMRGEYPGVRTRGDLANVIRDTVTSATNERALLNGRYTWYNARTGNTVIYNPNARDLGSVYPPDRGFAYWLGLR